MRKCDLMRRLCGVLCYVTDSGLGRDATHGGLMGQHLPPVPRRRNQQNPLEPVSDSAVFAARLRSGHAGR